MGRLKGAFLWSFIEKYASLVFQVLSTLILARLLTPEEIGVASVGLGIVAIVHSLRDFGISNYIVQEKNLTLRIERTAFGIACCVSAIAILVLLFLGNFLGQIFDDGAGKLREVVLISSISFLFLPVSSCKLALYKRNLDFRSVAKITVASDMVQSLSVIFLAASGWSYLSIPIAGVLGGCTTVTLCLVFSDPNRRFIKPSLESWREVLPFTGFMSVASIVKDLGIYLPETIIAKFFGFSTAGYFSRAKGLVGLFSKLIMTSVQPVILSYFSSVNRNSGDVSGAYIKTSTILQGVAMPFFGFVALYPLEMLTLLFGSQWNDSAPIAQVFSAVSAVTISTSVSLTCLVSLGMAKQYMKLTIVLELAKIAGVIFFSYESVLASCFFLGFMGVIECVFYFFAVRKSLEFNVVSYLYDVYVKAILLAIISLVPGYFLYSHFSINLSDIVNMIWFGLLTLLAWLMGVYILKHPLLELAFELIPIVRRKGL